MADATAYSAVADDELAAAVLCAAVLCSGETQGAAAARAGLGKWLEQCGRSVSAESLERVGRVLEEYLVGEK